MADAYDRYRPGPLADGVIWVLGPGATDALDLGAGTGAVTRHLIRLLPGLVVSAEPDRRMRAVLADRLPEAHPVGAVAEGLPFAPGSFDAVIVSSAWHWMDPAWAVPEIARVLRPGGHFGVLGNGPSRMEAWVDALLSGQEPSERSGPDAAEATDRRRYRHVELPHGAPFGPPREARFEWSLPMTADELVGLASTYSAMIVRPDDERAAALARVRQRAEELLAASGSATVELPMRCWCWQTTRLA
jgi:SAM-dependent methyltransferase